VFSAVALPSTAYEPKSPAQGALHRVVLEHLETFLAEAERARSGERLPRFVEKEFRQFLTCGVLAGGFARFHCGTCGMDRLVPFSCKRRGFCPSCGGRRMAERAAHLVDHVFPPVAVRQWVLSLPHRVRYVLVWDHALCRAVVAVYMRVVLGFLRRRAGAAGVRNGQSGAVAFVQRFGAALNLNVHVHALVLEGVFAERSDGAVIFHPVAPPGDDDVAAVLAIVRDRILSLLQRRGLLDAADGFVAPDVLAEEAPSLAGISAASVVGSIALGARAGARVRRCGEPSDPAQAPPLGRRHARLEGFDLHANVGAPAGNRERLERLCRYALRPPIAQDRLRLTAGGQVVLQLRRRWSDGTTHLLFAPIELLERLAALTPRPRVNLVLYYGVLAARARWRARIVAS